MLYTYHFINYKFIYIVIAKMYYIVNKVLFNPSNDLIEKQISCECLNMFLKKYEAINFINLLKHINIFSEDIILNNPIKKEPVNNKDVDGYHIIYDDENTQKYNIYLKKSSLIKGYVYNTVNININFVGFIEIITYNSNIKNTNITTSEYKEFKSKNINNIINIDKYDLNDKYIDKISTKLVKSVVKKNCIMPTIYENKEIIDETTNKNKNTTKEKENIEKSELTNIKKKQKIENNIIDNKHLYLELNDKLIEELKKKLDRL